MEIRQLKYFSAVADTLNFSRAAESLFVSQSTLSKQIADLEKELGVVLLKRDKRTVELTPAGKIFLNEAKAILMRIDMIPVLLCHEELSRTEDIVIHIGVEERVGDSLIFHLGVAEAVQQLRSENPGIRAIFKLKDYLEINREINEGSLDMGVFMGAKADVTQNMQCRVLYEDEMVLAYREPDSAPTGNEDVRDVLSRRALYLVDKEFRGMSQIFRILEALNSVPAIRFCSSVLDMTLIAESGEGCVIIPMSMAKRLRNRKLQILRIHRPEAKIYFMAMWKSTSEQRLLERIALRAGLNIEVMKGEVL